MMDKTFDPAAVEARIAARWEEAQAFKAGRPDRQGAKPYTIVIPPPNVTGSLHMGHALNNTLQDILCRFERMRGRDVLWQPGTDHAGIATQMVVERQLMERQIHRRELGREEFVRRVWAWKEESGGTIVRQLKRLGASCDWSRERFTMDEGLSRAVLKVFVDLYRQGLLYKDKRLVNWDPKFQTAISDLEVQQVEVKGNLWHIRYPIAGEHDRFIVVATTRPETMLGDVAVAVHPDDERYRDLVGRHAILPLVGRRIPIVADDYSDPEKGTGAVKITPAHDFNDFEVGRRHSLPLVNILGPEGQIALKGNDAFSAALPDSDDLQAVMALHDLDRFEARKRVITMLEERGALLEVESHTHMVPHGDRSGAVIEPYLTDQWYVNVKPLAERALAAVREGKTKFVPENWEKTYFQWLENIEPWCVSRQLWWGHQIPAWYDEEGNAFVAPSEEDARSEARAKHGRDVPLTRDEDVLDTWFSSALWPFSTLGWPDRTPELDRYYPTDTLVTGFDIIFFWVARMMMMGLHFMKEVPFDRVYVHSIIQAPDGRRMSKSLGTGIDPLDLIDGGPRPPVFEQAGDFPAYGADAVRYGLLAMSSTQDVRFNEERIAQGRQLANKLWNASRLVLLRVPDGVTVPDAPPRPQTIEDAWILSRLQGAKADVARAIDAFDFHHASLGLYDFVYGELCDWYLEMIKPRLYADVTSAEGPGLRGPEDEASPPVAALALHVLAE